MWSDLRGSLSSDGTPSHIVLLGRAARGRPGRTRGWAARRSRRPRRPPGWPRGSPAWPRYVYPPVASGAPKGAVPVGSRGRRHATRRRRRAEPNTRTGAQGRTVNGGRRSRPSTSTETDERPTDGPRPTAGAPEARTGDAAGYHVEILLICFASLLLEISYTRVISFKLFYYYTYLVIGLALLGIGCGSVLMAVSRRLKRATTDTILMFGCLFGAVSVIARLPRRGPPRRSPRWRSGTTARRDSFANLAALRRHLPGPVRVVRGGRRDGRRRCSAARPRASASCTSPTCSAPAWPASSWCASSPPSARPGRSPWPAPSWPASACTWRSAPASQARAPVGGVLTVGPGGRASWSPACCPTSGADDDKADARAAPSSRSGARSSASTPPTLRPTRPCCSTTTACSARSSSRGTATSTASTATSTSTRIPARFPFDVLGEPPDNVMIIGAAGGHEILASLYFDADNIDAIELNPLTYELVTDDYADYAGHLAEQPGVNYVNGDGRSFLARSDDEYDLIWYPAPDSYSATNAATAGAFVLSESYLYTTETIEESLDHLDRRRHHRHPVRRDRLRRQAEPHDPLRRHRPRRRSRTRASTTRPATCSWPPRPAAAAPCCRPCW